MLHRLTPHRSLATRTRIHTHNGSRSSVAVGSEWTYTHTHDFEYNLSNDTSASVPLCICKCPHKYHPDRVSHRSDCKSSVQNTYVHVHYRTLLSNWIAACRFVCIYKFIPRVCSRFGTCQAFIPVVWACSLARVCLHARACMLVRERASYRHIAELFAAWHARTRTHARAHAHKHPPKYACAHIAHCLLRCWLGHCRICEPFYGRENICSVVVCVRACTVFDALIVVVSSHVCVCVHVSVCVRHLSALKIKHSAIRTSWNACTHGFNVESRNEYKRTHTHTHSTHTYSQTHTHWAMRVEPATRILRMWIIQIIMTSESSYSINM